MTIYNDKVNEFINQLKNEICEINQDIRRLETEKKVYEKILNDLKDLKDLK